MNCILYLLLLSSFPEIGETIPSGPFSYPGQNPREIIIVDPTSSPLLTQAKERILLKIDPLASEEEILINTVHFVREELFDLMKCDETNVWKFIIARSDEEELPEIPLDAFLKEKLGVCRHIALTTTYLLDALIEKEKLKGELFFIREQTPFGRHAWTLLLTETAAWHIDAYWGIIENGKTDAGFARLCQKYGKRVMEEQKLRWEDDKNNFF